MQKIIFGLLLATVFTASCAFGSCIDCKALDFDKKVQLHLVWPMWTMTTTEKIDYVRSFGLDLYKVKDKDGDPVRVGFLPEPSIQENPTWERFIKIFDEGVMGLFLTPSNASNRVAKPTIFYNESADDWTIVHEFMHYLFDRARLIEDATAESLVVNNLQDAKEDFFENWNRYREGAGFRNESHKRNMIRSFVTFLETQIYLLENFELEEVIIEKYIRSIYLTQRPKSFNEKNFARSKRYIESQSEAALEHTRVMLETCSDIKKTLVASDLDLLTDVHKICDRVQKLRSQL